MANANDNYQRYFAGKLWSLVPATYKVEDGANGTVLVGDQVLERTPYALRALVELFAEQAAIARRGNDRLWDDSAIELCDDWAVPYIGELLGTRLLPASNPAGRRVDVAKTIYYRRRKGTVRVLAELANDIAQFSSVVVEGFKGLGRTHHALDERPDLQRGRFTGTPRGALADLRDVRGAELASGPFGEYARTVDMRQPRGRLGQWNINRVQLHIYRLATTPIADVTPYAAAAVGLYTFDPSGRPRALYVNPPTTNWDQWRTPLPWEVPSPIACRILGNAEYAIPTALASTLGVTDAAAADLRTLVGIRFRDQAALDAALSRLPAASAVALLADATHGLLLAGALVADCGKAGLITGSVDVAGLPRERVTAGQTATVTALPAGLRAVIDPEHGQFRTDAANPVVAYVTAAAAPIGAGAYGRDLQLAIATSTITTLTAGDYAGGGVLELDTSATLATVTDPPPIATLTVQAKDGRRPYLLLDATNWTFDGAGAAATLVLDGLWLGGRADGALVFTGHFKQVTIRSCTLDPGSEGATDKDIDGALIPPVQLLVKGTIETLMIDRCVTGQVAVADEGEIETLCIRDSILVAPAGESAIVAPGADLTLRQTTVLGDLLVDELYATDTIVAGLATIANTQAGCFRFSAALADSRVPHAFESVLVDNFAGVFTSRRFGDGGFCQLAENAPEALRVGAENGSERGAFSAAAVPIRTASLVTKVGEYLPFGLVPSFVAET